MERRAGAIEGKIDILAQNSAEIKKGQLANMPAALQWLSVIIGLIVTIMGRSFAILRFGMAH